MRGYKGLHNLPYSACACHSLFVHFRRRLGENSRFLALASLAGQHKPDIGVNRP
ncbi:hypothetical protein PTE30175_05322 [Pandoraea terrae]|uniref:Uncharacterized protein n=1 Tax=Pandoraea terrae TaxID=1537710 RepID=A0A5E4ZCR7_9BURK|nr:hypothetical protein PTE30175_05322 [Pandoraea terrae]